MKKIATSQFENRRVSGKGLEAKFRKINPFKNPAILHDDCFVTAEITRQKVEDVRGFRYTKARRRDLYRDIISRDHTAVQKVEWLKGKGKFPR